jgi:hypothetical protein
LRDQLYAQKFLNNKPEFWVHTTKKIYHQIAIWNYFGKKNFCRKHADTKLRANEKVLKFQLPVAQLFFNELEIEILY